MICSKFRTENVVKYLGSSGDCLFRDQAFEPAFDSNVPGPKGFIDEQKDTVMNVTAKASGELLAFRNWQAIRTENLDHRPSQRSLASSFITLEHEHRLSRKAGVLGRPSKPSIDVSPSFPIPTAKHEINMSAEQSPAPLLRLNSKVPPKIEPISP